MFEEEMTTAQTELDQLRESRDDIQLQLEASQTSLFEEISKVDKVSLANKTILSQT